MQQRQGIEAVKSALLKLVRRAFLCSHARTSRVFTRIDDDGKRMGHYIVCLDCGAEIDYDWHNMRVVA